MLKIKDNVDLKELEEYGFVLNTDEDKERYKKIVHNGYSSVVGWWGHKRYGDIIVLPISRKVVLNVNTHQHSFGDLTFDKLEGLYDLIQAGLIEKTEDK